FTDLNTSAFLLSSRGDWRDWALRKLGELETNPQMARLPAAYVYIMNYPDQHHLSERVPEAGAVLHGFKMTDYRPGQLLTIREAVERRQRHEEIEALTASMREHREIPTTFNGEIPELDGRADRLLIGRRYQMDDDRVGTLITATVLENE